jgi:malonate-semialdehyde dehydrogenase (acetylating)/methylmalonate-semialdehyde dehydrogenase
VGTAREWIPDLIERAKALKVSGGFEEHTDMCVASVPVFLQIPKSPAVLMSGAIDCRRLADVHSGPVISHQAKERIEGLIASVEEEGGKILLDGRGVKVPEYPHGNFVGPTVVEAVTTMKAYQ